MKKILAMVLALMMMAVAGVCMAEDVAPECVEVWDSIAMYVDGVEREDAPYISFFLYENGALRGEYGERVVEGTYVATTDPAGYIFTVGDQDAPVILDAETGNLVMTNEALGQTAVFALRTDMAAELNAESIDEFQGTWRVTSVISSQNLVDLSTEAGQEFLSSLNAADTAIVIDGNKVTVFSIIEGEAELVDGSLEVTFPYGTATITLTEGDSFIMVLHDSTIPSKMFADKE